MAILIDATRSNSDMVLSVADIHSNMRLVPLPGETHCVCTLRLLLTVPRSMPDLSPNEWVMLKTTAILQEMIDEVVVPLEQHCSRESCPCMSAGAHLMFLWKDDDMKEPQRLPAMEYINAFIQFARLSLANTELCPRGGRRCPDSFMPRMLKLHRCIFRIYAHAYIQHTEKFCDAAGFFNLGMRFKHWLFFARDSGLVSDMDLRPMRRLIDVVDLTVAGREAH
eukprot:CAMPEP_0177200228 /NCGR_PEP_ID=MMETSP0367-20130122/26107_1 /TAXON_ID=447022 ORGANISM="Scrippsiella hangoei-like, Strain SHHI-4" /NCGR_SAMPLE_ID=MMETSP0367 /ASSEMBLY_ACC=CAM_ASM_000362 /LENGTH=222 /DNA_ID=CAMNT_0018648653 /DNA_START=46 /DNA_END=714 /DNA_ORIENTATION=+